MSTLQFPRGKLRLIRKLGENKVRKTEFFQDISRGRMFVVKTIRMTTPVTEEHKKLLRTVNLSAIIRPIKDTETEITDGNTLRIALPFYASGSLADVVRGVFLGKANKKWNSTRKSITAFGLAVGLKYLHSKDVICAFLNPGNVLMTSDYEPKISDFWYPMCINPSSYAKEKGDDIFIAPEVHDGKVSRLNDIYSYGMILLWMLSGVAQIDPNVNPSTYLPQSLPNRIRELILGCLSPVLSSRPSLSDFIDLFQKGAEFFPGADPVAFQAYRMKLASEMAQKDVAPFPETAPIGDILDEKLITEMYKREADQQNKYAILLSAIHRREGKGCTVNKKIALKLFKSAAEKGIPEAQVIYGFMAPAKTRGGQNRGESAMWIKAAADRGNSEAQFRFAMMLAGGQGVSPDYEAVHKYMNMAIDLNNMEAALAYAEMLMKGNGIPAALKETKKYVKIAADMGQPDWQLAYAKMLLDEGSDETDQVTKYLRAAIANGNTDASVILARLMTEKGVPAYSSYELSKVYKTAADKGDSSARMKYAELAIEKTILVTPEELGKCYKIVADSNDVDAMRTYAEMLRKGDGVQRSLAAAASYYQKAADLGDVISQYEYGSYLFDRLEREGGFDLALNYLRKAADAGYAPAQYRCGVLLRDYGQRDHLDPTAGCDMIYAYHYFDEAAKQGDIGAKICKAHMMIEGLGCDEDYEGGKMLLKEAADQGSDQAAHDYAISVKDTNPEEALRYFELSSQLSESVYEAAWMYDGGQGTPKDLEKAFALFQKAANMDYVPAIYEVGRRLKEGAGVVEDPVKAAEMIRKAAERKYKQAMYDYADLLEQGYGCPKNMLLAKSLRATADNEYDYEEEDDLEHSFELFPYPA